MTLTARFLLPKIPREEVSKNDESKARLFFCSFKLAPKSPLVGVTLGNSGLMVTRDLRLVRRGRGPRGGSGEGRARAATAHREVTSAGVGFAVVCSAA